MAQLVLIISNNIGTTVSGPGYTVIDKHTKFVQPVLIEDTHANGKKLIRAENELKLEIKDKSGKITYIQDLAKIEKIRIKEQTIKTGKEVKNVASLLG